MYQQSVVLALKGWERAEKELESATEVLIFARSQWQKAVTDQNQEKQSTWDQNIKEAEKNVDKVKRDVDKAEEQFQKAAEGSRRKKQKFQQRHLRRPGGLCASACAVVAVAFDLHSRMVVVRFRGCCFLGSCSPLGKDPLVVKLSPLHVGEWRGLFGADGLLAASGFTQICCTCFAAWKRHLCGSGKGVTQSFLHLVFCRCFSMGCPC